METLERQLFPIAQKIFSAWNPKMERQENQVNAFLKEKKEKPAAFMQALERYTLIVLQVFNACHLKMYNQGHQINVFSKVKKEKPVDFGEALDRPSLIVLQIFFACHPKMDCQGHQVNAFLEVKKDRPVKALMKALHNLTLIVQKALNARHLVKLQSLEHRATHMVNARRYNNLKRGSGKSSWTSCPREIRSTPVFSRHRAGGARD